MNCRPGGFTSILIAVLVGLMILALNGLTSSIEEVLSRQPPGIPQPYIPKTVNP